MTELISTGDLIRGFIEALNPGARAAIVDHIGIDSNRTVLISTAAREHGWTAPELAAECSRHHKAANLAALITWRLQRCADGTQSRPKPTVPPKFIQPKPWCRDDLCQEQGRWRLHPETLAPIGHCECWTSPGVVGQDTTGDGNV